MSCILGLKNTLQKKAQTPIKTEVNWVPGMNRKKCTGIYTIIQTSDYTPYLDLLNKMLGKSEPNIFSRMLVKNVDSPEISAVVG